MGARTPLERMIQQVENGVGGVGRRVKIDGIEYDAKCYRTGMSAITRLDLKRVWLVSSKAG